MPSTVPGSVWRETVGELVSLSGARGTGQTEVEDLHVAVGRQEDVLGLQVSMDDALLVGRRQPPRDLGAHLDGLSHRERSAPQPLAQRLSLEQLHDGVGAPYVGAEVVYRKDVRMGEGRHRLGLALEAGQGVGALVQVGGQHLDRHVAVELRVASAVDLAHASGAEGRDDLVRPEPAAGCECQGSGDS